MVLCIKIAPDNADAWKLDRQIYTCIIPQNKIKEKEVNNERINKNPGK